MRKYLTQHGLKAFTILLPRDFNLENQADDLIKNKISIQGNYLLINKFTGFVKAIGEENFKDLPTFNFLSTFYDVRFVKETKESFEFDLVLNDTLNRAMWLRFKHTVFNHYNALIGFSDILSEVENLDDTDRLLIQRINKNVREMFINTKLNTEFEQLKDINFDLNPHLVSPLEYLSSFLRHRRDKAENIVFKYNPEQLKNVVSRIDSEYFKTALDLLFDALKESIDLSRAKLELQVKDQCVWKLEYFGDQLDDEFIYELQLINDFYGQGLDMNHLSRRMFHLIYIRLIVEKLGGEFRVKIDRLPNPQLLVEWFFPYIEYESTFDLNVEDNQSDEDLEKTALIPAEVSIYPLELRREIGRYFLNVDGVLVLDDWKNFANKLDLLIIKYRPSEVNELKQIIDNIYAAVKGFDVTALQMIMTKLKQIGKME